MSAFGGPRGPFEADTTDAISSSRLKLSAPCRGDCPAFRRNDVWRTLGPILLSGISRRRLRCSRCQTRLTVAPRGMCGSLPCLHYSPVQSAAERRVPDDESSLRHRDATAAQRRT